MDDDSTPMSRTELATLWDLLNRWMATHPEGHATHLMNLVIFRDDIDVELLQRFGG